MPKAVVFELHGEQWFAVEGDESVEAWVATTTPVEREP